ncbi:putative isomerase YitF [Halomonas elongata]|uniref:Putative isomerase YitF n=1 Tax=Halomonas elongata TaxID=2746 RepID=A0A1B8NVS4_HALEL|nr:putative isomerase YitF [Halomonas elongata]
MKIASVHTHILDYQLEQAFESASMRFERRQHCLVEVVCDDGTVGWGECLGPAKANATVVGLYAGALVGANPLETEKLWLDLYNRLRDQGQRGLTMTALSGIDIALWDIKGKHYGASISELLGGRFREEVRAYATGSFRRDGVDRVQDVAEEVAGYAREGFHGVKIKIGFDVEEDLRAIAAAREAIGPERRLMIDANHGYDLLEALEVGRRAEPYRVDWFEEPVLPEQIDTYRAVRQGQPIPVASGENWHGRYAMLEPLSTRAVDIAQPDVCGWAVSPRCGVSRTWRPCSACAWCPMSGERRCASPPACSSWRPCRPTRRGVGRSNPSWSSTVPRILSVRPS